MEIETSLWQLTNKYDILKWLKVKLNVTVE